MSEPKLNIKEETSAKKTRSPPKKAKAEQTVPKKKKLKTDADKAAEKAQHLRFGKAELTPDELSRLSKAQKREMYAAHAARSAVHREVDQYEDDNVGTAVKGLMNAAKSNAHVLVIVGVFLLLILMVMSGFSSCGILFSGGTQVSGQTMYSAKDRDIRGAEQDYKKLEKELDKKIKRTPTDHPGYNEYQYHLDPIEHDPWQLTSFLTTLYDDYTRSEVQGKLKETFKKQYKLTTSVKVTPSPNNASTSATSSSSEPKRNWTSRIVYPVSPVSCEKVSSEQISVSVPSARANRLSDKTPPTVTV